MTSPTPQAVSGISFELLGLLLFVHKVKFRDALLPVTTHYIRYVILCCVAHSVIRIVGVVATLPGSNPGKSKRFSLHRTVLTHHGPACSSVGNGGSFPSGIRRPGRE